jgi:hypothetical protein
MTDDKTRSEDERCLAMIEERLFPQTKNYALIIGGGAAIILALGFLERNCPNPKDEVLQQTQETIDAEVNQNMVNAYPGPPSFDTPYKRQIIESARRYGLEEKLLEGLMIASSEENQRYRDIPEGYRSIIALNPERAGVLSRYLKSDPELAIEQAARLYASIRDGESDEAKAIATFFAGREDVERAVDEEKKKLDEVDEQIYVYERLFFIMKPQLIKEKGINWLENLAPWQRKATYITLTHMGMHVAD